MTHPPGGPWITFRWADGDYALDVGDVVEILSARPATPVPGAAPRLAGIVSWRGRTLPVLNLPSPLKHAEPAPDVEKRMIVLRRPASFAVRVDEPGRILHAVELEEREAKSEEEVREVQVNGIRWMQWDGGPIRVLDPSRILGTDPLVSGSEEPQEDPA